MNRVSGAPASVQDANIPLHRDVVGHVRAHRNPQHRHDSPVVDRERCCFGEPLISWVSLSTTAITNPGHQFGTAVYAILETGSRILDRQRLRGLPWPDYH